jgi:GNAT superfamily N-acetyltransferase
VAEIEIRPLEPNDWEIYRAVRLAALQQSPECFGRSYQQEKDGTETRWRVFVQERTRFAAMVEGKPVGTISVGPATWTGAAAITSAWVDPTHRCRGIGKRLVAAALGWVRRNGLYQVFLRVNQGCDAAERLYCRHGFKRTGDSGDLGDGRVDYEMSLTI